MWVFFFVCLFLSWWEFEFLYLFCLYKSGLLFYVYCVSEGFRGVWGWGGGFVIMLLWWKLYIYLFISGRKVLWIFCIFNDWVLGFCLKGFGFFFFFGGYLMFLFCIYFRLKGIFSGKKMILCIKLFNNVKIKIKIWEKNDRNIVCLLWVFLIYLL